MNQKPALLGGTPLFAKVVPISCPTIPDQEKVMRRFSEILDSGMITTSKNVAEFEKKAAEYLGVKNVVATSSNTSGLLLTLKALGLKGDVIVPSFTFSVTGHALTWNNLNPIFVDIDPETCVIDARKAEAAFTRNTAAIMAVPIWGNPCPNGALEALARKHKVPLLFDSAQSIGSRYNGRLLGSFGTAEVFSCSPTKLLTSGEGGLVATNDDDLAGRVRVGRNYGDDGSYDCWFEGINGRMSEFHAALGLGSLEKLDENIAKRERRVALYRERLKGLPGIRFQKTTEHSRSNYVYLTILVDEEAFGVTREKLYKALEAENIQTRRYYHPPLHKQRVNARLTPKYEGKLPHTEYVSEHALTLPMFSHMTEEQVRGVCAAIERIHACRKNLGAARESLSAK